MRGEFGYFWNGPCISWLRACGNDELLAQPFTTLLGSNYIVRQDHFVSTDYTHSRGLGPQVVPSVFHHNGPLSRAAIVDYCNRINLVIPLNVADDLNQAVELVPLSGSYLRLVSRRVLNIIHFI